MTQEILRIVIIAKFLKRLASQSSMNTNHKVAIRNYRDVAGILKKMTKTFDKQAIADFVRDAKKKYPQRPALLEELSKVGAS